MRDGCDLRVSSHRDHRKSGFQARTLNSVLEWFVIVLIGMDLIGWLGLLWMESCVVRCDVCPGLNSILGLLGIRFG